MDLKSKYEPEIARQKKAIYFVQTCGKVLTGQYYNQNTTTIVLHNLSPEEDAPTPYTTLH